MYTAVFYFRSGTTTTIPKVTKEKASQFVDMKAAGSTSYAIDGPLGNMYVVDMTQVELIEFLAYKKV